MLNHRVGEAGAAPAMAGFGAAGAVAGFAGKTRQRPGGRFLAVTRARIHRTRATPHSLFLSGRPHGLLGRLDNAARGWVFAPGRISPARGA